MYACSCGVLGTYGVATVRWPFVISRAFRRRRIRITVECGLRGRGTVIPKAAPMTVIPMSVSACLTDGRVIFVRRVT